MSVRTVAPAEPVEPVGDPAVEDVREGQEADPARREAILKARIKRLKEAGKDTEKYELERLEEELAEHGKRDKKGEKGNSPAVKP